MEKEIKVSVVVTNGNEDVLLIKEITSGNTEPKWNVIKGTYNGGESIFDAAMRECKEEAGVDVTLTKSLGIFISEKQDRMRVQCYFLAYTDDYGHIASCHEQNELQENITKIQWCTKSDVLMMDEEEFVSHRTFALLQDWAKGVAYDLTFCKHVRM